MKYYAHTTENSDKRDWQTIKAHLEETAELSEKFAEKFNQKDLGYIAGFFHDLGKYSKEFQDRLDGNAKKVDHSTAGAIKLREYYPMLGKMLFLSKKLLKIWKEKAV